MAEPTRDKIKYGLLKFIDVSGFKVFDPPVRLLFGEDPKKQVRDIGKYMLLPILFVLLCVATWSVIAPNHKTKSGTVPTPDKVLQSYAENARFAEREEEKEEAFLATGDERLSMLAATEQKLKALETEAAELETRSTEVAANAKAKIKADLAPHQERLKSLRAQFKAAKEARKAELATLSEAVSTGTADTDALIAAVRENDIAEEKEKELLKVEKEKVDEILANPPTEVKAAQLAANKVADEVQHQKKVIDYLTSSNREVKYNELIEKGETEKAALAAASTPKELIKGAKKVVSNEERAEKISEQSYAPTATIFWQTWRSIATVFVGFVIAATVAIPLGILCGLNRIAMACLTPIISIFRPVSPVVWLLIFQIVIGAFFPDPDKHPLFVTLNAEKFFGFIPNPLASLGTNPAMIFSACTVAMCALWPALVNTALGVSSTDRDHINVARVLRLGFWDRLTKIIIPSSLPLVFAGLRISLGVGWMVLIAAEALSSSDGLGKFVWDEYQNGSSQSFANIILACFFVGFIGFFLDRIMIVLQRLVAFDDGSATA